MNCTTRKGVILADICNEYLLIASKEASHYCPKIIQLNDCAADLWKLFEREYSLEEMISYFEENYEFDRSTDIQEMISGFEKEMIDCGNFIETGNENEEKKA